MGKRFDDLVNFLGRGAKVAVIANALDFLPTHERVTYARTVFDPLREFRDHDLLPFDLDLRDYFHRPEILEIALLGVQLVWAVGGNAFLLRRAMQSSGFEKIIRQRLNQNNLTYGGWSAGAVVAGPTLKGIHLMDDPNVIVSGYDPLPIWTGLGLVDFVIVPHFRSKHPEVQTAELASRWLNERGIKFRTLSDGDVLIF
jgi:dipeptidase E